MDNQYIKTEKKINLMIPLKYQLNRYTLEKMYFSFIRPMMEYGIVVWGGTYDSNIDKLEALQIKAMRIIVGATSRSNITKLYNETCFMTIKDRRDNCTLSMFYKVINGDAPNYIVNLLPQTATPQSYKLCNNDKICIPRTRLESYKRSFIPYGISLWNKLPTSIRLSPALKSFKNATYKNDDPNILFYYTNQYAITFCLFIIQE